MREPISKTSLTRRNLVKAATIGGFGSTVASIAQRPTNAQQMSIRPPVHHRTIEIDGVEVFYRDAGPLEAPVVLLLHGFPTSSHMFRHLIPALADRWRVIAPDYPGFGYSAYPSRRTYEYSFANFATTISKFTDALNLDRYAIYIQDYGAPVGLRLALREPNRIAAIIAQNGNAYEAGLSSGWEPIKAYWNDPSPENRKRMQGWLDAPGIRLQYVAGVPEDQVSLFSPDSWTLDWHLLNRPGNIDMQLDLLHDYRTNVDLYPGFHEFFRKHQPPMLIPWGRYDPFFTVAGAQSYLGDLPDAELHLIDAGHFALESHPDLIISLTRDFLGRTFSG